MARRYVTRFINGYVSQHPRVCSRVRKSKRLTEAMKSRREERLRKASRLGQKVRCDGRHSISQLAKSNLYGRTS
jgi:hypothetical protein